MGEMGKSQRPCAFDCRSRRVEQALGWRSEVWVPHPSVLRVRIFSWVCSFPQRIDGDQSAFAFRVVRPTAPRPILRVRHQFSLHRILVHVIQFFADLLLAPHVKVVEASLPKRRRFLDLGGERKPQLSVRGTFSSAQGTRHLLLQNLKDLGGWHTLSHEVDRVPGEHFWGGLSLRVLQGWAALLFVFFLRAQDVSLPPCPAPVRATTLLGHTSVPNRG